MAFGEQIGEEKGTVTAFRVVKDGFGVKVESQFQGHGTMLGIPFVDYATYVSVYRPDGNFTGTADGVIFTQEAEAASYTGPRASATRSSERRHCLRASSISS